ncbi:MAG: ABC-2 family transporter protein [Candidatus Micrarchaeota archaeon]
MADKRLRAMIIAFRAYKAYGLNFALLLASFPVYLIVIYFIWQAILQNSTGFSITLGSIFTYYLINYSIGWCLGESSVANTLSREVIRGKIVIFLVRPMNYMENTLFERLSKFLFWLPIFLISTAVISFLIPLEISSDIAMIVFFVVFLFLAWLLNFMIYFSLGTLSFWFEKNDGIIQIFRNVTSLFRGSWIPLTLLPLWFQSISDLLPFKFIIFVPVSVAQGKIPFSDMLALALTCIFWIALFFGLSCLLWRKGLKHFTGHGV